jgi:hypothetical protein
MRGGRILKCNTRSNHAYSNRHDSLYLNFKFRTYISLYPQRGSESMLSNSIYENKNNLVGRYKQIFLKEDLCWVKKG